RDIHDTLGHHLAVIAIQLERAAAFRARDARVAEEAVADAKRSISQALREVRQSVGMLRGATAFSLRAALEELVSNTDGHHLAVDLRFDGDEAGVPRPVLMTLYRVAQEGLTNVLKHAQASHVVVDVTLQDKAATLRVNDNGQGFDTAAFGRTPAGRNGHFGLRGLRERLELIGGQLSVDSTPGCGTALLITVATRAPAVGYPAATGAGAP
ncbi:MAG: sensor histidine kinase, partial [Actinophytocola sp.]|uniref:sensor histidine kinase n=1 Tax=Actinophytocola sp. TaxID=1872138 RepID=UPI003D6C174A